MFLRFLSQIDDLELQLAAARKSAEQLELRHRILQTALGRSRHATAMAPLRFTISMGQNSVDGSMWLTMYPNPRETQ